ncbi:MAG: hypothetical protein ACKOOL_00800, partial [Novosphingobium sp.]
HLCAAARGSGMEAALKGVRRLGSILGLALFAIYALYWLMALPYLALALATNGGWKLWFDGSGPDGIAGPIFMWFLVLVNPATIFYLATKSRSRVPARNPGVTNVEL